MSPPPTLILGLGNPLRGDDGVGVRVAALLNERTLPDEVEVIDGGTQGLGLINLFEGRQRLIIVDAADMNEPPGTFRRFTLAEARLLGSDQHLSVHAPGLRDVLLLAQALEMLPPEVTILGVQPAQVEWDTGLSRQVQAALPALVEAVLKAALA